MKKVFFIFALFICQQSAYSQWNTERIMSIGQNALYFEDYVLSIQYFNQVIKIKPYMAEPYLYRAIAKIELGDYKSADEDCTEAIERNPFLPQAYYTRGFARRKMKFYNEAVVDFTKALEFNPNSLYLLMNRKDAYELNKEYNSAMEDLNLYMRLNPKNINLNYEKGRLLLEMKDTVNAEISFNKYIQLDSASSFGWSARGLLKMQQNEIDKALSDYNQAIKRNSTYSGDYINRGILNVQTKNYKQALLDYDKGIKLDNKSALAYYNRGLLRANLGDYNNALSDLTTVLQMDSSNTEALLRKAMLEITLGKYRNAISDYKEIIKRYQYFIPAYYGVSEAEEALGNTKNAFMYKQLAYNIEQNKDVINKKKKEEIIANNKAAGSQQSTSNSKTEMFNRFAGKNTGETEQESKYNDATRGSVQDKYTDIVNERNFILTYYAKTEEIRRTNTFYPTLEQYNKKKIISSILKITNNEIPLTAELINTHFEAINDISNQLTTDNTNPDLYFNRALEFALVQDFNSSIEDLNKAIVNRPNFMLAYFCRANIRYKLVEFSKSKIDNSTGITLELSKDKNENNQTKKLSSENQYMFDVELIMRDLEKVNSLNPDFSFSYFNKANILCTQKDFKSAIANYTKSIEIDRDFAEAYFNRGLTYIFIGESEKGLADLSKSGELGIYKAYNLLQRFKK